MQNLMDFAPRMLRGYVEEVQSSMDLSFTHWELTQGKQRGQTL